MRTMTMTFVACMLCFTASLPIAADSHGDLGALKTVRAKFAAFNRHDADGIERIYASDATLQSPDYPGLTGNKRIADTYRKLFAAIPDAQDNVALFEIGSRHVYAQFVLTGHLQDAQDKPVSVRIISVYSVRSDHIVEDTTYYDRKM